MRVLFVNPGGRAQGGAERSLAELIRGLHERGHRPLVMLMADGDAGAAFEVAGAEVVDVVSGDLDVANRHHGPLAFALGAARGLPQIVSIARRIRRAVRDHDVDLVHSNGFRSHVLTPAYAGRAPVVWSLRDRAPRSLHRRLLTLAALRADHIIANSSFTAAQLPERLSRSVIANPVGATAVPGREEARAHLGIPTDATMVMVLAHLHESKGHDVAIKAITRARSNDLHLAIAGGELYSASGSYRQRLLQLIDELGLAARVHLLGNVNAVQHVYGAADLVVHPCRYPEGFGRVIVESQLARRPVVATALGGVLDLIDDGRTGRLVEPDDPAALARALDQLIDEPAATARMVEAAAEAALRFSPEHHIAAVEATYRRVVGDSTTPRRPSRSNLPTQQVTPQNAARHAS